MLSLRLLPSTAGAESTALIGGQLVLLKGDWQMENCTLRFHPSFVAVVLPLVNSLPCLNQTEALSISCRLGGWVGRLRRDGGGDGGDGAGGWGGGVGRQSYIWALWGKINHVIISEKYGWISSDGSCPVHAAAFLTGLSLWLAFSMTLESEQGEEFWKHFNKKNRRALLGLLFPTLSAATVWEASSGFFFLTMW